MESSLSHRLSRLSLSFALAMFALLAVPASHADLLSSAELKIQGTSLRVLTETATVQLGTPALIQTEFGGKTNDQAPVIEGALVLGDLIGPGITTPIIVTTAPGHAFQVSGLSEEGVYYLQNIRIVKDGQLLQMATPTYAVIQVTNALQTTVKVRQLTPDELRARGITVDPSNFDVYEYTFSFIVNGQTVEIPYPVIINRITHEVTPVTKESPYNLPSDLAKAPPRWNPPASVPVELVGLEQLPQQPPSSDNNPDAPPRPQIHAAIVIPNSLAVLHQFFAVGLVVSNGAPAGSQVTLDSITASITAPNQVRIVKSEPAVSFGQPVRITDGAGNTFLAAQAQGGAEWTAEGLKAGTYTLNLDIEATFKSPGQKDVPLAAHPRATIVVHDARFNITFSHPDTVNKGAVYSAYTFVTNTSDSAQDIVLKDNGMPECVDNSQTFVCRVQGTPSSFNLHLEPGQTKSIQSKLRSGLTGHVYATAASIDGESSAINSASFILDMGVSATGVPLSPVTLILPYYASTPYFTQDFLDAQLGLFGLGYGLATAPLNKQTAKFPRIITSDVFTRAVDVARAGERMFIGEDRRDSLANLSLDLLGNSSPLAEWDQFRRKEIEDAGGDAARGAATALATELSAAYAGADGKLTDFAQHFAGATSYRAPYVLAFAHGSAAAGSRAYPIQIASATTGAVLDVPSAGSANWKRQVAYGDEYTLSAPNESGELALIGRVSDALDLTLTPTAAGTIDLIFPTADGKLLLRATGTFPANSAAIHIHIANGAATSNEVGLATSPVDLAPIAIVAARQDLHLDGDGHVVSMLFNRVLSKSGDLSADFDTDVTLDAAKYGASFTGKRVVAGAALQQDGRIIRLNYDSSLSSDAQYTIHTSNLVESPSSAQVVPVTEVRNSALILGTVVAGDNKPIPNADLTLNTKTGAQYQKADSAGNFLFEYVPRDIENGLDGGYSLLANASGKETRVVGAVRLLHTVHRVNVSFLGRGSARGHVRYDNGDAVPNATVVVGSTMFNQFRRTTTDAAGLYEVTDVPVGPLTFSAQDVAGNAAYAANELHAGGETVVQDVSIYRRPFPGTGNVKGRIVRGDTLAPVAGAHVGVYSQGYGLTDSYTDALGQFEFTKVPSGFVTVLGEDYTIAPQSIAVDFDLKSDTTYDTGDLVLNVRTGETMVAVEGNVTIEDPLRPGSSDPVPAARVQIEGMLTVIADANGKYSYPAVPQSFATRRIRAYDAVTGRASIVNLPTLVAGTNNVPIRIVKESGSGTGTVRVHLLSASGQPVNGYHVFVPGFPTEDAESTSAGTYEFADINAGRSFQIVAAPAGGFDATYGYQYVEGSGGVSFAGQIAAVTLRLPGQGSVRGRILQQTEAGVMTQLAGQMRLWYHQWSDREQNAVTAAVVVPATPSADAVFSNIPVLQDLHLETFESEGYASTDFRLGFDGDVQPKTLTLSTLSNISGRVISIDGYTPVSGASVSLGGKDFQTTGLDGSFTFRNLAPGSGYTMVAEFNQNGIFRTAIAGVTTPSKGGPVSNVTMILMKQGSVEGKIVTDSGAPIPFAKYWMRELSFPGRNFGVQAEPLTTDANGHFRINNVFTVPVRITAIDPTNPDLGGAWNGVLQNEGDVLSPTIVIGSAGKGSVTVTVLDPNAGFSRVQNAEIALYRGTLFDFATTDANGTVTFLDVPVGSYTATAYSKALGKLGSSPSSFAISRNLDTPVEITLLFSGEVDGTLTDPEKNDAVVPGANVTLYASGYQTRATTGTDGVFDFKGIREGYVDLEARDPLTIRRAVNRGVLVSTANGTTHLPMTLERTSTLTVKAFLPNDSGGNSGVLAPLVSIDVNQLAPGGHYQRTTQTNGAQFPGLVRGNVPIGIGIQEIGGRNRYMYRTNQFADGEAAKETDVVFPAFGSVIVHVQQQVAGGGAVVSVPNVFVNVFSGGVSANGYTDVSGNITLSNLPLGTVSVQATTLGLHPLTGATSAPLGSQSQPANATITIGSYKGLNGYVDAEAGGPSAGTRVFAFYPGTTLETRTDATGYYQFFGIVASANGPFVTLTYLGPDDSTVGAVRTASLNSASPEFTAIDRVALDSTPPRLMSIFPADGSVNVAPDTTVSVSFSRTMNIDQLGNGYVTLYDVNTNANLHLSLASAVLQPDKSLVAIYTAPAVPAGQNPLKSSTLYRIQISGDIQDSAGHRLGVTIGSSFTTSDYSSPQVTKVTPSSKSPLPKDSLRFAVTFSKPLAPAPWNQGGSGVMKLEHIDAGGNPIGGPVQGTVQLDPATNATLYFAPDVVLIPESRYRLSISGVTDVNGRGLIDASGNPLPLWTQDFTSYDETAPVVTIGTPLLLSAPIAANDPLYVGVLYTIPVTLTNPDGSAATDVATVDYYSVDGSGALSPINHTKLTSVDIVPLQASTSFTLRVIARDLSGNTSAAVTRTWQVQTIPALTIASTAIAPSVIYAGQSFTDTVALSGGAISANVSVSAYVSGDVIPVMTRTASVSRASFTAPWPATTLTLQVPVTTPANAQIVLTATASDARGTTAPKNDPLTLTADSTAPVLNPLSIQGIKSSTPSDPTSFHNTDQYRVHAYTRDGETGVASVTFTIGGQTYVVNSGTYNASTQLYDFVSPTITVQSHNEDFTVSISAVAADYAQNKSTGGTTVKYLGIHDPNAPIVTWITPLHDAAWPAGRAAFKTRLSVYATSNLPLNAHFDVPGIGSVTGVRNGNQFDADITMDTPATAQTITVTAHVDDGDGGHIIDLPIPVDLVTFTQYFETGTIAVDATHPLTGDSIVVDGARLVPHVALNLKNLIVINGGIVDTVNSTTHNDESIRLTISDHLFVDGRSRLDTAARGYLGGLQFNFDGTGQNNDVHGRTFGGSGMGGTIVNGAYNASASHAGIGGEEPGYSSNPTYGSVTAPSTPSSGGGADLSNRRGGQGGGVATVDASTGLGKIVVAGVVSADGESAAGIGGAGSGGSIHLSGKTVVLGSIASVTANGGDDDGGIPAQRGGGGGRISIEASALLDIDTTIGARYAARGGRNLTSENAAAIDGGAGTIFLRYPGESNGELLADAGFPASTHQTRATVIAGAQTFDRITAGPRALLRFDDNVTAGAATNDRTTVSIDPTARVALLTDLPAVNVTSTPANGGSIIQNTNLSLTYLATSYSGVGRVVVTLDPSLASKSDGFNLYDQNATATDTLLVPPTADAGSTATLRLHVIDRAGRVVDSGPQTFTIAANAAPVIGTFDLTAPSPLYIGNSLTATVAATDDISITNLALTTQFGTGSPSTQTFTANATPATKTFTVNVPSDKTLDGQTITFTASANDGFPNRTTTMVKTLTIAHDASAPSVTITQPAAGAVFNEGNSNLIHIVATVTDAESGVATVTATMEGGETVTLTGSGTTRSGDIHVPNVPDGNDLARSITITALDVVGNSGTSSVSVMIHPLYDPTAPAVTWNCGTDGAIFPTSYAATLSAVVVPGATGTAVDTVTFSDGTNSYLATKSGTTYTASYTTPATPGTVTMSVIARSIGGGTTNLVGTLTIITVDQTFSVSTDIIEGNTQYDNKNIAVTGGTLTISGHHDFKSFLVLGSAVVSHKPLSTLGTARVDIKVDSLYIACSAAFDASNNGYGNSATYPGATTPYQWIAGSHIGGAIVSGAAGNGYGSAFGSIYRPQEGGGGAYSGGAGGGIVHIAANKIVQAGDIRVNGANDGSSGTGRSGAGGSIWITTGLYRTTSGTLQARAGDAYWEPAGGGAVSVEYTDPTSTLPSAQVRGGNSTQYPGALGGSGTIYIKGPGSTYGDLTLDDAGRTTADAAVLVSLGSGTAQTGSAGTSLVTGRSATIPPYFAGNWVEITSGTTVKGTWRIATINDKTVTLTPNGNETISIQPGDKWQGIYRFDSVRAPQGGHVFSSDPIRIGESDVLNLQGPTAAGQFLEIRQGLTATTSATINGNVTLASITAPVITVKSGATLRESANGSTPYTLNLTAASSLTLESGAVIDASGAGYGNTVSYPGAVVPYAYIGGAHIGGAILNGATGNGFASSFGSIYHPMEAGGGAYQGSAGGGAVRINTPQLTLAGTVKANGADISGGRTGAGGSIWITASKITGTGGALQVRGGDSQYETGGGGAIAIEYIDPASTLPTSLIRGGISSNYAEGGSGTLFVKGPASAYGDLTVDNAGIGGDASAPPSIGSGVALSGSSGATLVTNRPSAIPSYFSGHWIEVKNAGGVLKGRWRIATINNVTVTLAPNGSESINVAAGDQWRGIYRFDTVNIVGVNDRITTTDPILIGPDANPTQLITGVLNGSTTFGSTITGDSITVRGHITAPGIQTTGNLTLESGAIVSTTGGASLAVTVGGTLNIASGASIDVSGLGYGTMSSYPGAPAPSDNLGGTHLGEGANVGYGASFGSIYQPQEMGGGGGRVYIGFGEYRYGNNGAGRVAIQAGALQLDGSIYANGWGNGYASGGGGSIWLRTGRISGDGNIQAIGGTGGNAGGGGAIAIEYTDATSGGSWPSKLTAQGGNAAAAGTIWVKGPGAAFGTLTVDNKNIGTSSVTELPSLGSGTALAGTSGATLVTDRTVDIPAYFAGNWVEVRNTAGTLRGRWKIASLNAKTITLATGSGEVTSIAAGDSWRGVYRFDAINVINGGRLYSADNPLVGSDAVVTLAGTPASGGTIVYPSPITGDAINITGHITAASIQAGTLTISPTGILQHVSGGALSLNVTGNMIIATGGMIDVSGLGYGTMSAYPGGPQPGDNQGGTHIGDGANVGTGSSFGSVYQPQELGGGSGRIYIGFGEYRYGSNGAGRVAIQAGSLQLDGSIYANGWGNGYASGAGGSVWIRAPKITGNGLVQAIGGTGGNAGAGGAIAVEYSDATSSGAWPANLNAQAGNAAASGTRWVKGPGATYGTLTVDNKGINSGSWTELPSLGSGVALSGTSGATLVTDRTVDVPAYFVGNWVELSDAAGNIKGSWRIASINAKTLTLAAENNGTVTAAVGDRWHGVYRFDNVSVLNGGRLVSTDGLLVNGNVAPVFAPALRSQIVVNTQLTGVFITAPAGAVTDFDLPIKLTVKSSHGVVFTGNASGDGSFNIPVTGPIGETFTISATDSNAFPATSGTIPVIGQIVIANPVTAFTVQPDSITPGSQVTVTIRIYSAAPSGGLPVTLTSSSAALPLPASVSVPAGALMTSFTATASSSVASNTLATLTAQTSGTALSANVTILPSTTSLASVSIAPSSVVSGTTAVGTVTLGGVAPAAGAVVLLSSSNSALVSVPQSVTVAPGATTATFVATALQTGTVDVVGIYGATRSAQLTVSACGTMPFVTAPSSPSLAKTWVDDSLPSGVTLTGGTVVTSQAASGTSSISLSGSGMQSLALKNGPDWTVVSGDNLVFYALINPCNPPREILAIWNDGTNDYRASWGEDVIDADIAHTQYGPMISGGVWVRLEAVASSIGAAGKTIKNVTIETYGGEAWFDLFGKSSCSIATPVAAPALNQGDTVWIEDALPAGATIGPLDPQTYDWTWSTTQHASGSKAHTDGVRSGMHQHYFIGATTVLTPATGDVLVTYVLIDPCNPVREIFFQWNDGSSWEHRAYWGEDLFLGGGTEGTVSRYRMGPLPPAGQWVRLEVPATVVGLAGVAIKGMAFDLWDGQAWFDGTGKVSRVNVALGKPATQISTLDSDFASRAVDGNTNGDWSGSSVTHTATVIQPWWEVDLGAVLPIEDIQLWNRTDNGWGYRLSNYWIFVSNDHITANDVATARTTPGVYAYHWPFQSPATSIARIGRSGRYVRIQLNGTAEPLSLAEVQVWAPATSMKVNLAGGGSVSQSSTYTDPNTGITYNPEYAVNGDGAGAYNTMGSMSHTFAETDTHWDLDLGSSKSISDVEVLMRTDCVAQNCASLQWPGFYVFVSDQPFTSGTVAQTIAQPGVGVWYHGALLWPSVSFPVYRTGRYVRVARYAPLADKVLSLTEVRVWAGGAPIAPLSTTPPTAEQNSVSILRTH